MDSALQLPRVSNAGTMPIKARLDMPSTGIRTPVDIKGISTDYAEMERLARQIEAVVRRSHAPPALSPSGSAAAITYKTITDRAAWRATASPSPTSRKSIGMALGGEAVTTTVEGRQRYRVNLRYPRGFRSDRIHRPGGPDR